MAEHDIDGDGELDWFEFVRHRAYCLDAASSMLSPCCPHAVPMLSPCCPHAATCHTDVLWGVRRLVQDVGGRGALQAQRRRQRCTMPCGQPHQRCTMPCGQPHRGHRGQQTCLSVTDCALSPHGISARPMKVPYVHHPYSVYMSQCVPCMSQCVPCMSQCLCAMPVRVNMPCAGAVRHTVLRRVWAPVTTVAACVLDEARGGGARQDEARGWGLAGL